MQSDNFIKWEKVREKIVYKELLCITDSSFSSEIFSKKPNESAISKMWGVNRIFVRRVLSNLYPILYKNQQKKDSLPSLSLEKLINILASIEAYWSELQSSEEDAGKRKYLSRDEKLGIISRYTDLSLFEMKQIGLKFHKGEILLRELFIKLTDPTRGMKLEDIMSLYNKYISYSVSTLDQDLNFLDIEDWKDSLIEKKVEKFVDAYFQHENTFTKNTIAESSIKKIKAEISRIEYQSGIKQLKHILNEKNLLEYEKKYFNHDFIDKLSSAIVDNQIINDNYSVHFKYFECERLRPLPLYIKNDKNKSGLLNDNLLLPEESENILSGLGEQISYKIRVHFYVILPNDYKQQISQSNLQDTHEGKRLDFFEEITGLGTPISHITAAINRVLFWDIPILREYFYVPRETINCIDVLGGESHNLAWNHTLVELFKFEYIEKKISENIDFDNDYLPSQYPAQGEYCGFDFLEVFLKASLNSRLKIIKSLRVDPDLYMKQLGYRIEELNALRRGKSYLKSYPFSLRAMESTFDGSFLYLYRKKLLTNDNETIFEDINPETAWNLVAYEAHLTIAEAYLKEGLFDIAKKYIDHITVHINKFGKNVISDLILAKYYLCCFRYCYLVDVGCENPPFPDRYMAINRALENLDKAQVCLDNRLRKMYFIGDLSLSNTHPFFYIKSRIFDHKAKLYIFFRQYVSKDGIESWKYLLTPIRLLEKSRIYAARDGNADLYSFNSAYQSWCYLMAAFLGDKKDAPKGFSKEDCINWSYRLIAHAEICYSPTGKKLWQDLKNNSGKVSIKKDLSEKDISRTLLKYDKYYDFNIQSIPLIQEVNLLDFESIDLYINRQNYSSKANIVTLDMSLLREIKNDTSPSIYLFGTNSSIILFVKGLYEVCCEGKDFESLKIRISKAKRLFIQSYSIAQDGGQKEDEFVSGEYFLERDFSESGDAVLKGLYLHRLTQFADLGKFFIVACELIELYLYRVNPQSDDFRKRSKHILLLSDKLLQKNYVWNKAKTINQSYYNQHLKEHYKNLKNYLLNELNSFQDNIGRKHDGIKIRDRIISDFFKLICGEKII